jgi:hypothetical protein
VDIPRVHDHVDAAKGFKDLGPEFGAGFGNVRVGDETNAHELTEFRLRCSTALRARSGEILG